MLKSILICISLVFYGTSVTFGQQETDSIQLFLKSKDELTIKGMNVLGVWGLANLGTGIYGSITSEGWSSHFHEMNAFWGGINLLIAYSAKRAVQRGEYRNLSVVQAEMEWRKTKKLFLINAGLDVVYIGGGLALMQWSNNLEQNSARVNAYGTSFVVQGGFLLGFDLVMYLLHQRNGKQKLLPLYNRFSFTGSGFRFRFG